MIILLFARLRREFHCLHGIMNGMACEKKDSKRNNVGPCGKISSFAFRHGMDHILASFNPMESLLKALDGFFSLSGN